MATSEQLLLAIPKGRILPRAMALLQQVGIELNQQQLEARQLIVDTNWKALKISVMRNSDILPGIGNGACDLAIAGSDQLSESNQNDYYDLYDLGIAKCWLKVAAPVGAKRDGRRVRVATKFVELARSYYARRGIEAQIVKLSGAMELAVHIGLADEIVDLVETGETLKQNGLEPVDTLLEVTSHLIANCDRLITRHVLMHQLIHRLDRHFGLAHV